MLVLLNVRWPRRMLPLVSIGVISGGLGVRTLTFWSGDGPLLYKYTSSLVPHFSYQSYATAGESQRVYADGTDRQTGGHHTVTLRFPPHLVSVTMVISIQLSRCNGAIVEMYAFYPVSPSFVSFICLVTTERNNR